MRLEIRVLHTIVIFLITGLAAWADDIQVNANQLCIHNGGEYWIKDINHSLPENGGGKYFPSFSHWSAQGVGEAPNLTWPWQIRGWAWTGIQVEDGVNNWVWQTCLQKSQDNPYASTMTWPYPLNYVLGVLPAAGAPSPLYMAAIPPSVDVVGGNQFLYPSSFGGFDSDLNIVAMGELTMEIPSTVPFEAYEFALIIDSALPAIQVPSSCSVYEYVWENKGATGQYLIYSGDETDSSGSLGGNKGKSYSVGSINGTELYYFDNEGTGSDSEWAMCLFVKDAISIPVNVPGVANSNNPYAPYGFDVGSATITPVISEGNASLQMMSLDFENPGTSRVLIAGSPWKPAPGEPWEGPTVPYGSRGYRIAHAWDIFTFFFSYVWGVWVHPISQGYPSYVTGTFASGGHSAAIPIPRDPILISVELKFSSFSLNGRPPSASFMTTFF
ncbi:MAG: hypothetical protein ABIK28_17080 [Planctomycetota bacterium]